MSQTAGTAGRPRQDGPLSRSVAPTSTPWISAIGSKRDVAMVLHSRQEAASKVSSSVKVCDAEQIVLKR